MTSTPYITSLTTDLHEYLGKPVRTRGCILLFCTSGYAVVEHNFTRAPFRKGYLAIIFSDTLFSIEKTSSTFSVKWFELSVPLTDEATFISSGPFFDWLDDKPVLAIPHSYHNDISMWLKEMEWIGKYAGAGFKSVMMRNQIQNLFLGLESVVKPLLDKKEMKTISSSRRIFHKFCQLLCENCRTSHNVRFYADKLCITPYYLSKVTNSIYQTSPKELIDRQLIMELKALLTTTNLTIKEIADRYCFDNASYLGRYFRRHVGMTPQGYRDSQNRR